MLKIFHTADWHLGQSFCGFDRDFEHARFLEWLLEQLQRHRPDALLLSGDVFDSINPSAVSQKRFYNFLARSHEALPELQMVITAGNHDAAARLEAPAGLLDTLNITVVGTVKRDDSGAIDTERFLVPLRNAQGIIAGIVLAVPFLRPADVPLVPDAVDPYLDGIRELYRRVFEAALRMRSGESADAALIGMGHCHLSGGSESPDSERRLVVGGAEALAVDVFDPQLTYVALGHLHRAQSFDQGRVRYSGSPIPLSFAETGYHHQILQVTLEGKERAIVDRIEVPRSTPLIRIPPGQSGPLEDLIPHLKSLDLDVSVPPEQHPFLEVRVLEDGPDPNRRARIEQTLGDQPVRLASIKVQHAAVDQTGADENDQSGTASLSDVRPMDIFLSAWQEKYENDPGPDVIEALREILIQESCS